MPFNPPLPTPIARPHGARVPVPRFLLCNGDATDLTTWSNTPYFLLQAGRRAGVLNDGLNLQPRRLHRQRLFWNLFQGMRTGRPKGFQYSETYARQLLAHAHLDPNTPLNLLSHFPFLPIEPWPPSWRVDFYIDATTLQVFKEYKVGLQIAPKLQAQVLERERRAYMAAGVVVCMCQWAADSVIADYQIDPRKVHVIPGGCNLDEDVLTSLAAISPPPPPTSERPLRLGFLGKEWQRKGGAFLLELAQLLCTRGLPTVIRAIGPDPTSLPSNPVLEPMGFIDKLNDITRFVSEVSSWHFGALFSTAEAAPRSNLECLRLGVPLITHNVGGISSTLPDRGCGKLFDPHPTSAAVADWLQNRVTPYEDYLNWRQTLALRGHEFTWGAAMKSLTPLLDTAP